MIAQENPIITSTKAGTAGSNIRISIDWELQQLANKKIEEELKACNSSNNIYKMFLF